MKRNIWLLPLIPLIALLTWAQGYWALYTLKDQPSTGCLNCSLTTDLLPMGGIISVSVLVLILILTRLPASRQVITICATLLLIVAWLWLDSTIFNDRVAAWSSFNNYEVFIATFSKSWRPILVCSLVWLAAFKYLNNKSAQQIN